MNNTSTRYAAAVASAIVMVAGLNPIDASAQRPAAADRFVGNWIGTLATPGGNLRLALTVTRDSGGGLAGVLTSLDQGNAKIPAAITLHGDTLVAAMPAAQASYAAVISATSDSLRGSFTQGMAIPLNMGRSGALPAPNRPQEPKPPFPYRQEDVTFESVPGVRLAGTVTLPPGAGPFPGVVLVTGSGPQDRNEELLGHKPFLVIADYLARHGIATLRYDDRGVAKSTGNFANGTSADFANDAQAGVHFLRTMTGISPDHVGIMGHSEGGMIAPMVAARSKEVAFIVLLAGPGLPGDSILLLQEGLIAAAAGIPQALIDRNHEANRRMFDALKAARDSADAVASLGGLANRMVATLPADQQQEATQGLDQLKAQLVTPWMRYFISYDPRPALRNVHVPVLALDGSLDLQVPPKADLAAISSALEESGNHDYRVVEIPGLNHLFQAATTGSPSEYSAISETFSPTALDIIATWINAHAGGKR